MKTFLQGPLALPGSASAPNDKSQEANLSSLNGAAPVWIQVTGTFTATYVPEVSVDGNVWVDATKLLYDASTGAVLSGAVTAPKLLYTMQNLPRFRWRCSAFTSAGAVVTYMGQDSRST